MRLFHLLTGFLVHYSRGNCSQEVGDYLLAKGQPQTTKMFHHTIQAVSAIVKDMSKRDSAVSLRCCAAVTIIIIITKIKLLFYISASHKSL